MNSTFFLLIVLFLIAVVFSLGLLIVIKQHRNQTEIKKKVSEYDDTENFYWIDTKKKKAL